MKTIDLPQNSPEWLEFRRGGVGASDIAAIMGHNPYKDAVDVYREKMGIEQEVNAYMQRGKDNELGARLRFCEEHGLTFVPLVVVDEEEPRFFASLDGYCEEKNWILEIKTPGKKTLEMAKNGKMPPYYFYQIQ